MKRIFVAIKLSNELQSQILELINKYQDPRTKNRIRWVAGKNLHITLVPPWPLGSARDLRAVTDRLNKVKFQPFEIKFNQITFGPNEREPRMLWLKGGAPKEVLNLRLKIYECLGQQPDARPFRLHVTLARLKNHPSLTLPLQGREALKLPMAVDWKEKVNSFVLMESHLLPQGADYEVLLEVRGER